MNEPNRPSDALFVLAWIPIVIVIFGTLYIVFHH
jgi:hypothetical protein